MNETGTASVPDVVATLIRGRRTIHSFRPDAPPRALIVRAIDLARWAPNHRLTEPCRFYLLGAKTADAIARLNADLVTQDRGSEAGSAKLRRWRSMPGWMVVTCAGSDDPVREREDYAACCCAMQNFSLFLWGHGIGVKWSTGAVTREPRFYEILQADPDAESVVGLFWYGYPAEIPNTDRKPLAEIIRTLD